ncbi:MAG: Rap1a/Tai family immunity protein [Pseudomonadota bacterium]
MLRSFTSRPSAIGHRVNKPLAILGLGIAFLFGGPGAPPSSYAKQFVTVGDLEASCRTDSPSSTLFCLGMIEGVAGSNAMYQAFEFIPDDWRICPDVLDSEQMRTIFVSWAEQNSQDYDRPAVYGIALALRDASPCA